MKKLVLGILLTLSLVGCSCPCEKKPQSEGEKTSQGEDLELIEQEK